MRPSVFAILGSIVTVASLAGGIVAVEERYAHAQDLKNVRIQLEQKILEDRLDRTQERIWRIEDRGMRSMSDLENRRRLEMEKQRLEQQLKMIEKESK